MTSFNAHEPAMYWCTPGNQQQQLRRKSRAKPTWLNSNSLVLRDSPALRHFCSYWTLKLVWLGSRKVRLLAEGCASPCLNWNEKLVLILPISSHLAQRWSCEHKELVPLLLKEESKICLFCFKINLPNVRMYLNANSPCVEIYYLNVELKS